MADNESGVNPPFPSRAYDPVEPVQPVASDTIPGSGGQAPAPQRPTAGQANSSPNVVAERADDPAKQALEIRKLVLEIKALTFKQSLWGRFVELLHSTVPVLAILGLIWTVFTGLHQQESQRVDAESARFERAYTKLGSRLPSERATGVAQASSLLGLAGGIRDKDVLTALANQLALDEEAVVRSAILNVFSNLDRTTSQDALNATLTTIIDLQRVIVQSSGLTPFELATAQPDDRGLYFIPSWTGGQSAPTAFDPGALHATLVRLSNLRAALLSILKAGGRTRTMGYIYCPSCNFAELGIDLSGVSFQGAILPDSEWSRLRLVNATFRDAVIEGANFTGAQLEGADFSNGEYNLTRQDYVSARALRHLNPAAAPEVYLDMFSTRSPTFVCANVSHANFQNFPVVTRLEVGSTKKTAKIGAVKSASGVTVTALGEREAWPMAFRGANVSGADFREARAIILRPIDPTRQDPYAVRHEVRMPQGSPYRYYASSMPLTYLRYFQPGKSATADRERDKDVEALALTLVQTDHYEQAKLPPGVIEAIKDERDKTQSHFPGCAAYLK